MTDMGTHREPSAAERARLIGGLVIGGLLLLFLLQNFQTAEIRFLWFSWTVSTAIALLGAAIGGALLALGLTALRQRRRAARAQAGSTRTAA